MLIWYFRGHHGWLYILTFSLYLHTRLVLCCPFVLIPSKIKIILFADSGGWCLVYSHYIVNNFIYVINQIAIIKTFKDLYLFIQYFDIVPDLFPKAIY